MSDFPKSILVNFSYSRQEYDRFKQHIWPIIDKIDGFLDEAEAFLLYCQARNLQGGSAGTWLVEIGSFKGKSTTALALGLKDNPRKGFRLVAVDPFIGDPAGGFKPTRDVFESNIRQVGVEDLITVLAEPSTEAALKWPEGRQIALILVDGDHRLDAVSQDLALWLKRLPLSGAVVILHDIFISGVYEAARGILLPRLCFQDFTLIARRSGLDMGLLAARQSYYRPAFAQSLHRHAVISWFKHGLSPRWLRFYIQGALLLSRFLKYLARLA